MKIKEVNSKIILDSRKQETIFVEIETNVGIFGASSPTGKSTGKFEAKPYLKNINEDIKQLKKISEYFHEEEFDCFEDLRKIEDITEGHIGANTNFALESAVLKAIASEKKIEVWELINKEANKIPRFVGNVIGGGKHSEGQDKKPDFQEFLIIPDQKNAKDNWKLSEKIKDSLKISLTEKDPNFKQEKNDENAWKTSLGERNVLSLLHEENVPIGIDVASSSFYKRKKYRYFNPKLDRSKEEQINYLKNLVKNFKVFYLEDPLEEEDFEGFAELLKQLPETLIVGDDLTVTNLKRLKKAIKNNSINGIIVKPNQCGSLIEVKEVCELAKKNNIKIVFSHRSGETEESILADLAFGFEADFLKCGVTGKERETKIKRLIEIANF